MYYCHICGNKIGNSGLTCPFCGSKLSPDAFQTNKTFLKKTVNLEQGRPVAEVALNRMNEALEEARRSRITILTFIHGYGSSGKGGVIRTECRKNLDYLQSKGAIQDVILGEDFNKRSGLVKGLLRRYPQLVFDRNLNTGNRGITLVVL